MIEWLTESVPQNKGEVIVLLALFGELEEGSLSSFWIQEIYDEAVDIVLVVGDGQARAQSVGKGMGIVDESELMVHGCVPTDLRRLIYTYGWRGVAVYGGLPTHT